MISEVGGVAQVTSCDDKSACDSHVAVRPCGAEYVVAEVREPKTKESEGSPSGNVYRRAVLARHVRQDVYRRAVLTRYVT